jgi:hypothetical protein
LRRLAENMGIWRQSRCSTAIINTIYRRKYIKAYEFGIKLAYFFDITNELI